MIGCRRSCIGGPTARRSPAFTTPMTRSGTSPPGGGEARLPGPAAYQFGYDAADQVLSATKQMTGGTPSVLARYRYAYDPAGNRTSEQIDDAVVSATYNSTNELVSTQPAGGLFFSGTVNEPASVTI